MKREVRFITGAHIRANAKDAKPGVTGYAAVFNQLADLGWFRESIAPGAFKRALAESQDVRCLQNHDANLLVGRTKNGTLRLAEDGTGLKFDCDFPDTQAARDLHALLERGDMDQCSFGFTVRKQSWTEEKDADGDMMETRIIEEIDQLFDVSPVTYPAYEGTSCEARSIFPDGIPEEFPAEVRSRIAAAIDAESRQAPKIETRAKNGKRAADCECDCPECEAGDCANCSDMECDDPNCDHGDRAARTSKEPPADVKAELAGQAEPSEDVIKAQLEADRAALEADADRVRYTQTARLRAQL